ncbi:MAG TPA: PilX N-terminal domain-containing pilus assembly protein [Terriglobales bacterium]|nr:PilX N-terminal domain-containing pilus assembly protein [Terriglobales bacterium]
MRSRKLDSRGFTLIATLMLLLIMSGIAIGLLMMVNTEGKVGGQDIQNNLAFHAAEGGIEHMTSDLANMFQNIESPTPSEIEALSADAPPSTGVMSYPVYTLTPATTTNALGQQVLATNFGQISSGTFQGLYAQILPVTLQVTASTFAGAAGQGTVGDEVNMSRTVEVALIPVFQFGVFSESDLSFFAGVNLDFNGRTHTNGDLYLLAGSGATTTFEDKITAWGNVIRTQLADGNLATAAPAHLGTIDILTTSQGCTPPATGCRSMAQTEGSVVGGATSAQNPTWNPTISIGDYNSWIIDGNYGNPGGTGASQLSLPFINNALGAAGQAQPFEIIRRPPPGEVATTALGASRLYNEAEIRVMLSDNPAELSALGAADPNNIRLANFNDASNGVNYQFGVPATPVAGLPVLATGGKYNTYFATASTGVPNPASWTSSITGLPADELFSPIAPPAGDVTLFDANAPIVTQGKDGLNNVPPTITVPTCSTATGVCAGNVYPYYTPLAYPAPTLQMSTWNLLDGYLRVEYRDANGAYHPVTQEWLQLGFARGTTPPTAPGTNPVNPNAILILQELADRNGDGTADPTGAAAFCTGKKAPYTCTSGKPPEVTKDPATPGDLFARYGDSTAPGGASPTQFNWYPVNLYDAREGEVRDVQDPVATSCAPAGVMNAVEIDVGNLSQWLAGKIGASGLLVDPVFQNGYVLYFSDRRGMLPNPNGTQVDAVGTKSGDSGLEDSINTPNQTGKPNGALEPIPVPPPGAPPRQSPEDVNNNGKLDNWGAGNLGLGLGYVPATTYSAANSVNSLIRNAAGAPDPYLTAGRIASCSVGQKGWISGARHVLKLVDGALGYVPVRSDNGQGGFTVAAENPVYILGNYNSNCTGAGGTSCTAGDPNYDGTWNPPPYVEPPHAAAGVLADAVTMLSNNWSDLASLGSPSNDAGRPASTTYYRVAVSGGKNINFLVNVCCAAWAVGDWGTDGGLHNFLRQLENWGGQTLNYKGSMASLYYSTYSTGTDKNGGGTTYEPPARNYIFDPLFTQPQNLPPGTPLFRDIDNLSYRQSFTPRLTSCY